MAGNVKTIVCDAPEKVAQTAAKAFADLIQGDLGTLQLYLGNCDPRRKILGACTGELQVKLSHFGLSQGDVLLGFASACLFQL